MPDISDKRLYIYLLLFIVSFEILNAICDRRCE